jgi:hypothetical protein
MKQLFFQGGFTGAGIGALSGAPGGPVGMLAGIILGGYFGAEGADIAYTYTASSSASNLNPPIYSTFIAPPLQDVVDYPFLNILAQRYYQNTKRQPPAEIGASLDSQWITSKAPDQPIAKLYNQFHALHYLITQHSYFMSPKDRANLGETQEKLKRNIEAYQPKNPAEAIQYYELKDKFSLLGIHSTGLLNDIPNDAAQNIHPTAQQALKTAKNTEDLHKTLREIPRKELTENAANTPILMFIDGHWEQMHIPKEEHDKIAKLKASQETAMLIGSYGELSMQMGRLATAMGNAKLGRTLTFSAAALSGMSSAMLFSSATGAATIGYAASGIGAVATITTLLLSDPSDGNAKNFQTVFRYFDVLHQQIASIQHFLIELRPELYERPRIYFGATQGQLSYLTEIMRNSQAITLYQSERLE